MRVEICVLASTNLLTFVNAAQDLHHLSFNLTLDNGTVRMCHDKPRVIHGRRLHRALSCSRQHLGAARVVGWFLFLRLRRRHPGSKLIVISDLVVALHLLSWRCTSFPNVLTT